MLRSSLHLVRSSHYLFRSPRHLLRSPRELLRSLRPVAVHAGVLVLYTALALLHTRPLWAHLSSRFQRGHHFDVLLHAWTVNWTARQLLRAPWDLFDSNSFFPHSGTLAYREHFLGEALPVAPVYALTEDPILTYNLAFLLVFVLAGWGTFLLCRRLTGSTAAALVAGAFATYFPAKRFSFAHFNGIAVHGIPLAMLALHRVIARPTAGRALVLGVATAFSCLMSAYLTLYFGLLVVVAVPLVAWVERQGLDRRRLAAVAGAGLVTVALGLLVLWPYATVAGATALDRGYELKIRRAVDVAELFMMPTRLWTKLFTLPRGGDGYFPGLLATGLVALAFLGVHRSRGAGDADDSHDSHGANDCHGAPDSDGANDSDGIPDSDANHDPVGFGIAGGTGGSDDPGHPGGPGRFSGSSGGGTEDRFGAGRGAWRRWGRGAGYLLAALGLGLLFVRLWSHYLAAVRDATLPELDSLVPASLIALGLGLVGLAGRWRYQGPRRLMARLRRAPRAVWAYSILAGLAFLLAMGVRLKFFGYLGPRLPGHWLYQLPLYRNLRMIFRAAFIGEILLAVPVAFGVTALLDGIRSGRSRWVRTGWRWLRGRRDRRASSGPRTRGGRTAPKPAIVAAALILAMTLEYVHVMPPLGAPPRPRPELHGWLAEQPGSFGVLDWPPPPRWIETARDQWLSVYHWKGIAFGHHGGATPDDTDRLFRLARQRLTPRLLRFLEERFPFRYFIVHLHDLSDHELETWARQRLEDLEERWELVEREERRARVQLVDGGNLESGEHRVYRILNGSREEVFRRRFPAWMVRGELVAELSRPVPAATVPGTDRARDLGFVAFFLDGRRFARVRLSEGDRTVRVGVPDRVRGGSETGDRRVGGRAGEEFRELRVRMRPPERPGEADPGGSGDGVRDTDAETVYIRHFRFQTDRGICYP